jgi:hypothetical protein
MVRFFCGRSGLRELGRRCKAGMIWRRRRIEGSCAAAASRSKHHHDRGAYDEPVSSSSMTHNDQPHTCSPFCRTELAMSQGNRPFVMPEARQTVVIGRFSAPLWPVDGIPSGRVVEADHMGARYAARMPPVSKAPGR